MRYGIFSDVHANEDALGAALAAYRELGIDRFVCLGDVVGYGARPNECCERVRELAAITILGNHDAAVCGRMDYSYYYDAAREALDYHASLLTAENMAWLRSLPYEHREGPIAFCHGSPVNHEEYEYIFARQQAARLLPVWYDLADVTFIGHSHLCKAFALARDSVHEVVADRFVLREGYKYIVSVGSVGQPRDQDSRACVTVFDTTARTFEYRRIAYDIDAAAGKIFATRLEPSFGHRLFAGI